MARKEAIFSVGVDTGNSVNQVQKLSKEVDKLQTTTESGRGMDKFEQDLKDLDALIDSGTLDITQMTKAVKDYQTIAFRAGANSPVGAKAIQQASDLTDRIGDLNTRVKQGSNDYAGMQAAIQGANVAMSGFTAFKGATALLGEENEELMKTMTQLQGAMGVMNSLSVIQQGLNKDSAIMQQFQTLQMKFNNKETKIQIALGKVRNMVTGKGTKAMKLLRTAMISTGIGAVVVGLSMLVANFTKVSKWVRSVTDNFKNMGAGVKIVLSPIYALISAYDAVVGVLQKMGIVDSEETKKRKQNAQERVDNAEDEKKAIGDKFDFEIAKAKASGKETFELEQEKRKVFRETTKKQIKDIIRLAILNKEYTDEQRKQVNELKNEIIQSAKDSTIARIANNKKVTDNAKKANQKRIENAKKASQKRIENAKKEQDEINKILMDQISLEDEIFKMRLDAQDLAEQNISEKYDALFLKAHGNAELEKQLLIQQETELSELRAEFAESQRLKEVESKRLKDEELLALSAQFFQAEADAKMKAEEKKKQIQKESTAFAMSSLNAISDLNDFVSDMKIKRAEGDSKKQEKIARTAFNVNKAVQLSIAGVQAVQAVQNAFTTASASPLTIANPAYPFIQAGIAGTTSAINIAKIASAKFKGGAPSTSGGSGGSGGSGAGASASSFSIGDNTSSTQTELNPDGTQQGSNGVNKVVVVETDITNAVNNIAQIDELSTF